MAPLTFTEWETLAPAGPIRPSISLLARQQLPLHLPWSTIPIPIGTNFFSSRASGPAPFGNTSPFDATSLSSTRLKFEARDGGQATFTNTSSRHTKHNEEHLSASLGVSVGCKFLSVGVTGSYDENVVQNSDDQKKSLKSTWRSGTVFFDQAPSLSAEAIGVLMSKGLEGFQKKYGDYYVAGYQLGADTAVMISTSECDRTKTERVAVKVEAQVAFWSAEHVENKFFRYATESAMVNLSGFDTLSNSRWKNSTLGTDLDGIKATAAYIANLAQDLPSRVDEKLQDIRLDSDSVVTQGDCLNMCRSGIVVEIVLLPISRLRQVQLYIH